MCSSSVPMTRCSAAEPVGSVDAHDRPAARACVLDTTSGGSTRADRILLCSPPRPILGGVVSGRTSDAGCSVVVTARPAVGCVNCTLSGGNALAAPI